MKRLVDLNPKWITAPGYDRVGITFDCPDHGDTEACPWGGRIGVFFTPSLGGTTFAGTEKVWQRVSGLTFDDLTLTPSINCYLVPGDPTEPNIQDWHGFITGGDVT